MSICQPITPPGASSRFWSGLEVARALREDLAREELDAIRGIPTKGAQATRLRDFIREFEGTTAEKDARVLLGK